MPRYKLRTLLLLLAILPPLLAVGWGKYLAWRAEQEKQKSAQILTEDSWLVIPIIDEQGDPSPRPGLVSEPPPDSSDLEHGKGP